MNNTYNIPSINKLNLIEDIKLKEQSLHDQRTSKWFDTFLKHTNEKSVVGQYMKDFVSQHIDTNGEKLVLDIGCGEGELAGYIVDGFQNRFNVNYYGIDNDAAFLVRADNLLSTKNVSANFIHGSCFNSDIDRLPYNVDLIIGSHVAYYASDMKAFINSLVNHLSSSGTILLMHAPEDSDQNVLRTHYGAYVDLRTVNNIKDIINSMQYLKLQTFTIKAEINFPNNASDLLSRISNLSEEEILQNLASSSITDLKDLLEFTIQRPLESLADYDLLHEYIGDMHYILGAQHNKLYIKDEVQVIIFNTFDLSSIDSIL